MSQEAGSNPAAAFEQDPLDAAYEELPAELLSDDSPADEDEEDPDQEPEEEEEDEPDGPTADDESAEPEPVRDWNGNVDELPEAGVVVGGVRYNLRAIRKEQERGYQERMRELAEIRKELLAQNEKPQAKPEQPADKEPPIPVLEEMTPQEWQAAYSKRLKWEMRQELAQATEPVSQITEQMQHLQQERYAASIQSAITGELAKDGDRAAAVEAVAMELADKDVSYKALCEQGRAPEAIAGLMERAREVYELRSLRGGAAQDKKQAAKKKAAAPSRVVSRPGGKQTAKGATAARRLGDPASPSRSMDDYFDAALSDPDVEEAAAKLGLL